MKVVSFLRFAAFCAFVALFSGVSHAAQNGKVIVETMVIREAPDEESHGVAQAKQGEILRISSKSKEGWFKVLLPGTSESPQYGWVSAQELLPLDLEEEMRIAKVQSGNSRYKVELDDVPRDWSVAAYYHLTTMTPKDLQGSLGFPEKSFAPGGIAGELNLSPAQTVGFSIHYTHLSLSESDTSGTSAYDVSTHLISGIVDYYFLRMKYIRLGVGVGLGAAPTSFSLKRVDSSAGALSGHLNFLGLATVARVTYRQYLLYHFGLAANAGYRNLTTKKIGIIQGHVNLQMSGFFAEFGAFLEF